VGVATGPFTTSQLEACGPDLVLSSWEDVGRAVDALRRLVASRPTE
jgi:hypothetical protein